MLCVKVSSLPERVWCIISLLVRIVCRYISLKNWIHNNTKKKCLKKIKILSAPIALWESVPTYSTIALQASRVRIPDRWPNPAPPLSPTSLPATSRVGPIDDAIVHRRWLSQHLNCFWMHNCFLVSHSLSRFAIARTLFILWSGSTCHKFYKIRLSVVLRICKSFANILSHLSLLRLCVKWNCMYCNVTGNR